MPSIIQVNQIEPFSGSVPNDKVFIKNRLEQGDQSVSATGYASHAEGVDTNASGNRSHAEGYHTTAVGDNSHAEGNDTRASGLGSHAEGLNSHASGEYAHASGRSSLAQGNFSTASGEYTTASGLSSHSEGKQSIASGDYSHAEGLNTDATGDFGSHSEGALTLASGSASHAEGISTEASGANGSHAEGKQATASGEASHAQNNNCTASGSGSHAEGVATQAVGAYSHAQNSYTTANGDNSTSAGRYTVADADNQFLVGTYNIPSSTEGAFIIGNGTFSFDRNLLVAADQEVEIFGKTSTETIKISDGAFDGYVLTSDALGNGTWQSIGALTDTFVTAASLNGTDLEIDRNNGQPQIVVDLSSLVTPPGIDTFVTNAALNGLTLEIDRNQGQPQLTVDLSSLAVDTNNYLTNATLNGTLLELDRFGLSTLTVDLASINTDTFVVSGAYDDVSNTITLTRNDAGTIDITGIADSYVTGAVLNGSTLELARNEGLPTLSVDLSPLLDDTTATVDAAADPNVNVDVVFYSASTPGGTIYLNSALNVAGKKIVLIRTADTNAATLAGSIGTQVNGSSTKALPTALYSTTTCISDGTNWYCTNGDIL